MQVTTKIIHACKTRAHPSCQQVSRRRGFPAATSPVSVRPTSRKGAEPPFLEVPVQVASAQLQADVLPPRRPQQHAGLCLCQNRASSSERRHGSRLSPRCRLGPGWSCTGGSPPAGRRPHLRPHPRLRSFIPRLKWRSSGAPQEV
eukprot:353694-Chlamydomonas_euryale.AAC.3